jgi:UDP-2,3-diacylglucosamine pyrophosphatase LpxH
MGYRCVDGADFAVTIDDACPIRCEVLGDQIEFWFGDVGSGLHLFFDRRAYVRFAQVQSDMVDRLRNAPDGARISFVVGDDDVAVHGAHAHEGSGGR